MIHPKKISIRDYTYDLASERIALHPLPERDASKLLVYQNGNIEQDIYKHMDKYLPGESLLVFNNSKVIKARIRFQKNSGGIIEIFCLEPYEDINEYSSVMNKRGSVKWKCMIGGASKWKEGGLVKELGIGNWELKARLVEKLSDAYIVEFSWMPSELSFAEVLERSGEIPLPPYIKRKPEAEDTERYQTIYAQDEGSVAAPTAGLHFTKDIFNRLSKKNILTGFVTLHVGAGTFKPVKASTMEGHEMHAEWIDVSVEMIENLLLQIDKAIVAVGTTSLRTLESLYWMGIKTILHPQVKQLQLSQWEVYEEPLLNANVSAKESLTSLLNWLRKNDMERLFTQSQILIAPGYHFKIISAIITNFHQPQSTLLLLVAAATGDDLPTGQAGWRKIYAYAMQNDFRFLSYGDGSLLFINK
jgi:S-adenosylmethionine:tRNA ribosyltransferase-isomerase